MRGKKFYFILMGILLVGLSAVYFFKQQQNEKYLEFEAYEIESVEKKVASLYNEEKTDLSEKLSMDQLQVIQEGLEDLKTKEYSPENQRRLEKTEEEYLTAKAMIELQANIEKLFVEKGVIEKNLTLDEVDTLEEQVEKFQEQVVYYNRNQMSLKDAKEQVAAIEAATNFMDSLFEEDFVRPDVTRENEEEALELIGKIKNEEIKEELLARAEKINVALTEAEEALALEEALAEEAAAQQELEEDEELEESSEQAEWSSSPSQSETWNSSGYTGSTGNTGNTGNKGNTGNTNTWTPPSNSSPTAPPQENNQSTRPEDENVADEDSTNESEESDSDQSESNQDDKNENTDESTDESTDEDQ